MLLPVRVRPLVAQRGEGAGDAAAGGMRHDHLVDETAFGGDKGIGGIPSSRRCPLENAALALVVQPAVNDSPPRQDA